MIKIGLLSDTHSYLHPRVFEFFKECEEVWHCGDIGDQETAERLSAFRKFRAVYGNIDGTAIKKIYPEKLIFKIEGVKVVLVHIGGYPGKYTRQARELMLTERPDLFICGHSHILKVIYDKQFGCLHINPGAAGKFGFHHSITMVRFGIRDNLVEDLEVLDIPRRDTDFSEKY